MVRHLSEDLQMLGRLVAPRPCPSAMPAKMPHLHLSDVQVALARVRRHGLHPWRILSTMPGGTTAQSLLLKRMTSPRTISIQDIRTSR